MNETRRPPTGDAPPGARRPSGPQPSRDSVTTIKADGSRPFLYPADAHGRFATARRLVAGLLMAVYFGLPWLQVGGHPAVFLDVAQRRFHLFGITLAAQDLWLLFFVITGLGFSLFFVTALLGRIWCGWACPQTVFLDHVYRRVERWIEGDAVQRRALAAAPLTAGKLVRRVAKHSAYLAVSATIAHLFLAYFVSLPEVWAMSHAAPGQHWGAFVFMAVFTGALYFNFAWFREQLCIVICPYGRIQSALIDDHSLVIGYDVARGEPRGRATAVPAAPVGDCVDCRRCVQVCPTGIDIRQGLQLECIGCTACIDACDDVMTRLERPKGLIRYDSQKGFTGGRTRWLRVRTLLYAGLLLVGAVVALWALSTVRPAVLGVTRMVGAPYVLDGDTVRNQFLVRLVNKSHEPVQIVLRARGPVDALEVIGFSTPVEVGPLGELVQPLVLRQARGVYRGPFTLVVRAEEASGRFTLERAVEFLGPEPPR